MFRFGCRRRSAKRRVTTLRLNAREGYAQGHSALGGGVLCRHRIRGSCLWRDHGAVSGERRATRESGEGIGGGVYSGHRRRCARGARHRARRQAHEGHVRVIDEVRVLGRQPIGGQTRQLTDVRCRPIVELKSLAVISLTRVSGRTVTELRRHHVDRGLDVVD